LRLLAACMLLAACTSETTDPTESDSDTMVESESEETESDSGAIRQEDPPATVIIQVSGSGEIHFNPEVAFTNPNFPEIADRCVETCTVQLEDGDYVAFANGGDLQTLLGSWSGICDQSNNPTCDFAAADGLVIGASFETTTEFELSAARSHADGTVSDDVVPLQREAVVKLPGSVEVITGSSGGGTARLDLGDSLYCIYRGRSEAIVPNPGTADWDAGTGYDLESCTNVSGATFELLPTTQLTINGDLKLRVESSAPDSPLASTVAETTVELVRWR